MRLSLSAFLFACAWSGAAMAQPPTDPGFACGGYQVRQEWEPDGLPSERSVVFLKGGVEVDRFQSDDDNGWFLGRACRDLTGDGRPDIVIASWTRGMHCCITLHVVGLGEGIARYRPYPLRNGETGEPDKRFVTVDGRPVLKVYDDTFAYWGTAFALSPFPWVWASFDGVGWQMDIDLQRRMPPAPVDAAQLELRLRSTVASQSHEVFPAILAATLDLIYTGRAAAAWDLLAALKPIAADPKVVPTPAEVMEKLSDSPHCGALARMNGPALAAMTTCVSP